MKAWLPSPESPAPSRLELQLFYLPFQPYSCGTGVAGVLPTNDSFQGFLLFIYVVCLGGQGRPLLTTGQTQDNATLCVLQGRFLDFIVLRECCAQVLAYQSPWKRDWKFKMSSNPNRSMTLFLWKRENLSWGGEINGNFQIIKC